MADADPGTSYYFSVQAVTGDSASAEVASNTVVPIVQEVKVRGNAQATASTWRTR